MADYHLSMKALSRGGGRSSVAAAAYRAGVQLLDARTGLVHDYGRRSGVVTAFIAAPDQAPDWVLDRGALWDAVEAAEKRSDANTAREIVVALPHELTDAQREELARAFAAHVVEQFGVAVDGAIHEPSRDGDQRNHHFHLLSTTRRVTADGLGSKLRVFNDRKTGPEAIRELRAWWADRCNSALEAAKVEARVDHRSHAVRRAELEAVAEGAERAVERAEGPGLVGRVFTRAETRRDRAKTERDRAESARAEVSLLGEPTTHRGRVATALERRRKRLEREDADRRDKKARELAAEAEAKREADARAAAAAAQLRFDQACARMRETLDARDERLEPPRFEAFVERCDYDDLGFDDLGFLSLAWSEAHERWFDHLRERLEREQPTIDAQEPAPGVRFGHGMVAQAGAQALFRTPAWQAHAAQAVTRASVDAVLHPRPSFVAFREVARRLANRLVRRAEARPDARRPDPGPEPPKPSSWRPRGP